MEQISDALQLIPTKKEELRRAFEILQSHYSSSLSSSFHLQWSDIDSHLSSLQTSLQAQFNQLQSNHSPKPWQSQSQLEEQQQPLEKLHLVLLSEFKSLCSKMDGIGLGNFTLGNRNLLEMHIQEVPKALSCAPDPFKLVLDSLQWLNPMNSTKKKLPTIVGACRWLLQGLSEVGQEIRPKVREDARELMAEWKRNDKKGKVTVEMYLHFVRAYALKDDFSVDELVNMLVSAAGKMEAVDLCKVLGLDNKVPDIIRILNRNSRHIAAMKFIYAFELVDTFPPVPLLEAHLKDIEKTVKEILVKENNSYTSQMASINIEISGLSAMIRCIKRYELESQFPPASLENRIEDLEKKKNEVIHRGPVADTSLQEKLNNRT